MSQHKGRKLVFHFWFWAGQFFVLLILVIAGSAEAKDSHQIRQLEYRSSMLFAPAARVWLTSEAIEIESSSGYLVVAKAPGWSAVCANEKTHKFVTLTRNDWASHGVLFVNLWSPSSDLPAADAISAKGSKLLGLACQQISWKSAWMDGYYRIRKPSSPCLAELYETSALPCSQIQAKLIAQFFDVPLRHGLPLVFQKRFPDGKILTHLRATSIKLIPSTSVSFSISPEYKKVSKRSELITGMDQKSAIDLLQSVTKEGGH